MAYAVLEPDASHESTSALAKYPTLPEQIVCGGGMKPPPPGWIGTYDPPPPYRVELPLPCEASSELASSAARYGPGPIRVPSAEADAESPSPPV